MDILIQVFGGLVIIVGSLFVLASIVLFIKDGIDSKKEGRSRKIIYTLMFIVSMVIVGLFIVGVIFLNILAMLIMRSM